MAKSGKVAGRKWSWALVLALAIFVTGAAVASAVTAPGSHTTGKGSLPTVAAQASSLPTSTTVAPSTSTSSEPTSTTSSTVAESRDTTTTMVPPTSTTIPVLTTCEPSQFAASATTDALSYALGQTINITLTLRDSSSEPCNDTTSLLGTGCWNVAASAINEAGQDVWDSGAAPITGISSCAIAVSPTTIPGNFSSSEQLSWSQVLCTNPPSGPGPPGETSWPNPNCLNTQVPAGTYEIEGEWEGFQAPPIDITIESS